MKTVRQRNAAPRVPCCCSCGQRRCGPGGTWAPLCTAPKASARPAPPAPITTTVFPRSGLSSPLSPRPPVDSAAAVAAAAGLCPSAYTPQHAVPGVPALLRTDTMRSFINETNQEHMFHSIFE